MNRPALRINKFLAERNVASRREADRLVQADRVTLNGQIAQLGDQVGPNDEVRVDGILIEHERPASVVLAYHKPRGIICTLDPRVRDSLVTAVHYPDGRVFPVGRLDVASEGLLLMTNDGDLVNLILRAEFGHEKEYYVTLHRELTREELTHLSDGSIELDGRPLRPCRVDALGARQYRMILTEGRNRQIRRMMETVNARVIRLRRDRVMNIELGDLPLGEWRRLEASEDAELRRRLQNDSAPDSEDVGLED